MNEKRRKLFNVISNYQLVTEFRQFKNYFNFHKNMSKNTQICITCPHI